MSKTGFCINRGQRCAFMSERPGSRVRGVGASRTFRNGRVHVRPHGRTRPLPVRTPLVQETGSSFPGVDDDRTSQPRGAPLENGNRGPRTRDPVGRELADGGRLLPGWNDDRHPFPRRGDSPFQCGHRSPPADPAQRGLWRPHGLRSQGVAAGRGFHRIRGRPVRPRKRKRTAPPHPPIRERRSGNRPRLRTGRRDPDGGLERGPGALLRHHHLPTAWRTHPGSRIPRIRHVFTRWTAPAHR